MKYRTRENIFNKIIVFVRKVLYRILKLDKHRKFKAFVDKRNLIPLISYDIKRKYYKFHCYCLDCPCNGAGVCVTNHKTLPLVQLHEFDNDNIIKNWCG